MGKKKTDAAQYDAAWKEALQLYFREFLAFFFPAVETDINWDRGLEFLDKEFHQIVQGLLKEKYQSRSVDKLVRVHRKNGKEELVLVHVEIQSQKTGDFCERMYLYNSLIYRRYGQKVASFAVLADSDASWRPDHFGYQLWGSEVRLSFPMVKLIDYRDRTRELETHPSPFSAVVLAHLMALETGNDPQSRYLRRLRLTRGLYQRGFSRDEILSLYRIIGSQMPLPHELELQLRDKLKRFEEEHKMPIMTFGERIEREEGKIEGKREGKIEGKKEGMIEGKRKGVPEGKRVLLIRLVRSRFGEESADRVKQDLGRVDDPDQLDQVGDWVLECVTAEDLLQRIKGLGGNEKTVPGATSKRTHQPKKG